MSLLNVVIQLKKHNYFTLKTRRRNNRLMLKSGMDGPLNAPLLWAPLWVLIVGDEIDKKNRWRRLGAWKAEAFLLDQDQHSMGQWCSIQFCRFLSRVFQFYGSRFNTGSLYAQCFIVLTDFWLILRTQLLSSVMFVTPGWFEKSCFPDAFFEMWTWNGFWLFC